MLNRKRVLIAVSTALLLAGGIGGGLALAERGADGAGSMEWSERGGDEAGERGEQGRGYGRDGGGDREGGLRGWWNGWRAAATPEEIDSRLRERFARLDRNSDGVIDRAEVEAMMAQGGRGDWQGGRGERGRGPGGGAADEGGRLLQRFDENRDGKVTKEEFLTVIKRRFAEMDLDNDGRITEADLPPMLRGRGILTAAGGDAGGPRGGGRMAGREGGPGREGGMNRMIAWLRAADANHDGIITLDEVVAHAEKQFARLDRNGDGVLDQADRDIARKEMTDYRVLRYLHMFGADKDGKITREQFTKVAKERMARADLEGFGRMGEGGGRPGRGGPGAGADDGPRHGGRGGRGRGRPDAGDPRGPGAEPPAGQPPAQPGGAAPGRP